MVVSSIAVFITHLQTQPPLLTNHLHPSIYLVAVYFPMARMNQQPPPEHCERWMVGGQETLFCWVPVA
jgi:hypothetical protein